MRKEENEINTDRVREKAGERETKETQTRIKRADGKICFEAG
jgi:hypothetical protein